MIKAKDYAENTQHSRIDAAMLALGFEWNGSAYTKIANGTANAVGTKTRRASRKIRASWPKEFYRTVAQMPHGATMDITEEVQSVKIDRRLAINRIYSHFFNLGQQNTQRYTLDVTRGRFILTRI